MYTKEERRKNYQNIKKYTDIEVDYIVDLEMIADNLNDFIINSEDNSEEPKVKDFTKEINIIENIQNQNINIEILSYTEYLFGAILSFHKEIINENYTYDEFEKIIKEDCWIDLVENNPDIENIEFIKSDTNSIIADFIKNSKYPWALATGIAHCYYIRDYNKKHPNKKYIKRFDI